MLGVRLHKEIPLFEQSNPASAGQAGAIGPIGLRLADRFRIDRLIGTGGMATVYEATDLVLGRTVAVKLFRLDTADDAGPERQSGEVTLLASLNHFALVTLFDAGTTVIDGVSRTFIVMEFVDGTDLRSRIAAGPLPAGEAAALGADLAEALHYVHSRGIIHRDIKPANVLLAPSGFPGRAMHAKLADFGIARLFDATRLTATGSLLGTAGYLSPEQALGATIGPPSDVYSLGLVLLECLTGERAFPGTAIESAMARLQRSPGIPASLGPEWVAVLDGMTAREPGERLSSGDAAGRLRRLAQTDAHAAAEPTGATVILGSAVPPEPTMVLDPLEPTAVLDPPEPLAVLDQPEPLEPTLLLPAVPAIPAGSEDATVVFAGRPAPHGSPAAASPASVPRRRGRRLAAWVLGAVLVAAIVVLGFAMRPVTPDEAPASYPAVDGTLGQHLKQLQESLTP